MIFDLRFEKREGEIKINIPSVRSKVKSHITINEITMPEFKTIL